MLRQYKRLRKHRKKVEMLFAHLKHLIIVLRETAPYGFHAIMRPCHTKFFASPAIDLSPRIIVLEDERKIAATRKIVCQRQQYQWYPYCIDQSYGRVTRYPFP
jgi:hypothetical protein